MLYTFGDHYTLDPAGYELRQHGRLVRLEPRVFDLVAYLVQHPDRIVTKEELLEQLWPQQFVADNSLTYCVAQARKALGDAGQTQRYIQTVRRRGYRFIAPVVAWPAPPVGGATTALAPGEANAADTPREPVAPRGDTAAAASPGERKLVTVLGCTLAPAPGSSAQRGLDAVHHRMRTLYTLTQQAVHQYGGTIQHVAGTRLLALFGAPVAYEDHARRAVLAAWELHQRLATSRGGDPTAERLAACLGLHTGLLVVGGLGEAPEPAVIGDLTLAVEALQTHAAPGMLLCSAATARLVQGDVQLEAVPLVPVPGQPTPLRTYQVVGLHPRHGSERQAAWRARSPFVGRTPALTTLHAVLAQMVEGRGQVVGIVGEPGIGKSRLLMEWCQQLRAQGVISLEGYCLSYSNATPYLPVLDLLRAHCGITPADGVAAITAKVCGSLQAVGLAPDAEAPWLLHLLGVGTATEQMAGVRPDTLKAKTFETLRQLWLQCSQRHPLILAVEDLHWSDPTSEEFFASLVECLPGAALCFLGTYRPGYRPLWMEKSYATQLSLPPLSAQDSVQLLRAVLQRETVPPPLAEALLARAQGNPFFLEELAQTLVEQGVVRDETTSRSPLPRPSLTDLQLPPTVQAVLAARIDSLSRDDKHLLQCAAVIGTDVPVPLLQAITALPEAALDRGLAHLQAAEFLYETRLFPDHAYTFKHVLTQEVAYESLLQERRRALHARIVAVMEALAADRLSEQVERLAHHTLRGEVWDKALGYCRQAGEKALVRSAYREAVGYFEQALTALRPLPETRARHEQALDLRLALRTALSPSGDWGRMLVCLREAEALAVALDDPPRLGQISSFLSLHFAMMGAYDQAIAAGQRALALATASGDSILHALANRYLGEAYHIQGDYRRAIDCLGQTVAALDGARCHEHFGQAFLPAVASRARLAVCHAELGAFAAGRALGDEGLRIAEAVVHPASRMNALWGIGLLALRQGDLPSALPLLERAMDSCQHADFPYFFPWIAVALGEAYTLAGRVADAVPLLTRALAQTTATAMRVYQALCRLPLGEAQMLAGRLDEAYLLAERALALARAHQERGNQAYALRLLGEIAARRVPPEAERAEAFYHQALALADELGMRPLQSHCHLGLGTLYAKIDRREQARTSLSVAMEMYRAMAMTFWLPQAEAVLAQVEARAWPRTPSAPHAPRAAP